MKQENPSDWNDMMREFESIKRTITREVTETDSNSSGMKYKIGPLQDICIKLLILVIFPINFIYHFTFSRVYNLWLKNSNSNNVSLIFPR